MAMTKFSWTTMRRDRFILWTGVVITCLSTSLALMHITEEFVIMKRVKKDFDYDIVTSGKGLLGAQMQYIPLAVLALTLLLPVFTPLLRRVLASALLLAMMYCAITTLAYQGPSDMGASVGKSGASSTFRFTTARTLYLVSSVVAALGSLVVVLFPGRKILRTGAAGELDGWRLLDRGEDPTNA